MSSVERLRPSEPRGGPVSPQLALRIAIIGSVALVMFGIIFFRLWYLQVLTGEQYVQQAQANDQRELPTAAPRGEILDSEGQPLVTSQVSNAVQILPSALPASVKEQARVYQEHLAEAAREFVGAGERLKAYENDLNAYESRGRRGHRHASAAQLAELHALARADRLRAVAIPPLPSSAVEIRGLFQRLAPVIGLSPRLIYERVIAGITQLPYAPVTIKTDAGPAALTVLGERHNDFPGVKQQEVAISDYRFGELASQTLGHVGQVNKEELELPAFKGVPQGTVVGQSGLEYYYDRYLRGTPGVKRVQVNSEGQPEPTRLSETPPKAGHDLKLSINLGLERVGERALRYGVSLAQSKGNPGSGAAFVAINPLNGEIYGMGSYPGYDPNRFAKPMTQAEFDRLNGSGESEGPDPPAPLLNRAVEGQYPTGSTFKPITAMGALEAGVIDSEEALGGGSCITAGAEQFCNSGKTDYGALPLVDALKVSSDTYFFTVGEYANEHGDVIQNMAKELGIGKETHVDLPNEIEGTVPDAKWREGQNKLQEGCEHSHPKNAASVCHIVAELGPWTVGDNMHLAVGQGELLTSPLQMAVAYSTLASAYTNGGVGTVVRPHLGVQIDNSSGGLVQELPAPPIGHVHLNDTDLNDVMEGIHDATFEPGGTSADVWSGWNQAEHPVYGKTGTAERTGQVEQAWYMCYLPDPKHPIVIAVTVEQGGFGDEAAAPAARLIASQWFHKPLMLTTGTNPDQ
ncbi:MAG TPA: penicillin-binding transpeptidase domain-containing protein [Solirubrobacteraceae bacterium]|nr:penicillin-binding transpeptidase domain-containing protein [Solirubrobacteraceae bacterium]